MADIGTRSSPSLIRRYGSATQAAENYATKTITLVNQNLDQPNLADIQALCLLVIHEWGSRNAVRAYIYLGQAARMLQMYRILNSHHSPEVTDQFLRDESLRRTLWLIYILDTLLTSMPGRYPALSVQDSSDVPLPCSDFNFAFANAVSMPTLPQHMSYTTRSPGRQPPVEVGEFAHIVVAATVWRDVVGMLTMSNLQNYHEEECNDLINKIEGIRASLPMQYVDKPGQMNLHMTMGSGYNYAMIHCLLQCASIFVQRRRLLQDVTSPNFNIESFRMSNRCHEIVDQLFTSSHGTISLLNAFEAGAEKDHSSCLPIVMLFSAFTASATIAYLSLKGLTPPTAVETAAHIVKDGLRFMHEGTESWPLMSSWLRHLTVMQRVLTNDAAAGGASTTQHRSGSHAASTGPGVKDEISSNADTAEPMDQDNQGARHDSGPRSVSESAPDDSDAPVSIPRRSGVTTINGGSSGIVAPTRSASPPHGAASHGSLQSAEVKQQTPDHVSNGVSSAYDGQVTSQDMTAPELCLAFERQLLDLDDLAAFMGGGV